MSYWNLLPQIQLKPSNNWKMNTGIGWETWMRMMNLISCMSYKVINYDYFRLSNKEIQNYGCHYDGNIFAKGSNINWICLCQ